MTTARRITLAIYVVILAANFIWVPWRSTAQVRPLRALGSGFVWQGPGRAMSGPLTEPDMRLILLRSFGITTLGLGIFALLSRKRHPVAGAYPRYPD